MTQHKELQAENARLRGALQTYATDLCENANQDWCGMLSAVECAGCIARQALKDAAMTNPITHHADAILAQSAGGGDE